MFQSGTIVNEESLNTIRILSVYSKKSFVQKKALP